MLRRRFRRIWKLTWLPALIALIFAGPGLLIALVTYPDFWNAPRPEPTHVTVQDFCITQVLAPNLGDPEKYGYKSVTTDVTSEGTYKTTGLVLTDGERRAFTCTTQVIKGSVFLVEWTIN